MAPETFVVRPSWRSQYGLWLLWLASVLVAAYGLVLEAAGDGPRWLPLVVAAALIAVLALPCLALYRHFCDTFTVTGETVESRHGIIARNLHTVRIRDIRNVNVDQGVLDRLLGIGDVEFSSAGGSGIEVVFRGVREPVRVRDVVATMQARLERADPGS